MKRRVQKSKAPIRTVALILAAALLGGCGTYHKPYYVDSGAYYRSAGDYSGVSAYSRTAYASSNPAVYPYWSIDYFYFSQHYHPYSVYVGYHEPLYYPYPGWALGYHRPLHARRVAGPGFGYPWHGHRYPRFSLGFFASHDPYRGGHRRHGTHRGRHGTYHEHPIRRIDQRLAELQHRRDDPPRRVLLTRRHRGAEIQTGGSSRSSATTGSPRIGRQEAGRRQSRLQLLQARDSGALRTRSQQARADERPRLRGSDDVRRASRRADLHRSATRRARVEDRPGRLRAAREGISVENLRGRVVVNTPGERNRWEDRTQRRERAARKVGRPGMRSIRRSAAPDRGDANRGRRAAESAPDASRLRESLTRRAQRSSGPDSRAPRPDRQRSALRRASSSAAHGKGEGTAGRRDRSRTRFEGRRRR